MNKGLANKQQQELNKKVHDATRKKHLDNQQDCKTAVDLWHRIKYCGLKLGKNINVKLSDCLIIFLLLCLVSWFFLHYYRIIYRIIKINNHNEEKSNPKGKEIEFEDLKV